MVHDNRACGTGMLASISGSGEKRPCPFGSAFHRLRKILMNCLGQNGRSTRLTDTREAECSSPCRNWTFPLTSLKARLKCPMCGSRKVSVIFDLPSEPAAMRIAGMPSR
jgi:hypothetical protein